MPNQTEKIQNNKIRLVMVIAAGIGLIDSAYLSYVKLFHTQIYCSPGLGDCASVNQSRWSEIWGIPIALFGLATYLVIIAIIAFSSKRGFIKTYSTLTLFGISLVGFLFSMYLTYIEFFVLHTTCQWCLLSALMITTIFIASITQLVRKK